MGKIKVLAIRGLAFLSSISVLLSGCQPGKYVRNSFKYSEYCHSEVNKLTVGKILSDGYYSFHDTATVNHGYPASRVLRQKASQYIFYEDGEFAYINNSQFDYPYWGSYVIAGDTIKAQFIEPVGQTREKGEVWFKIINNKAIESIGFVWRKSMAEMEIKEYQSGDKQSRKSLGIFVKESALPDPNKSWLKNKSWFWCNTSEYKNWKKLSR